MDNKKLIDKLNLIYKQHGGGCENPFKLLKICDVINSKLDFIVNIILIQPINLLINSINVILNQINDLFNKLINIILNLFNVLIRLINTPINLINIISNSFKDLFTIVINLLSGDIFTIGLVYIIPLIIYLQTHFIEYISYINPLNILYVLGITDNTAHLPILQVLFLAKIVIILIYISCWYGFIKLLF